MVRQLQERRAREGRQEGAHFAGLEEDVGAVERRRVRRGVVRHPRVGVVVRVLEAIRAGFGSGSERIERAKGRKRRAREGREMIY